jgi:hypothetical protein
MGNIASNITTTPENESEDGIKHLEGSDGVGSDEITKKVRFSENNLRKDKYRDDYVRKITQSIRKENDERYSIRNKAFLEQFPDYENISNSSVAEIGISYLIFRK